MKAFLSRKELKARAKQFLKKHYVMFVAVCLVAAFLNAEFGGSLEFLTVENQDVLEEEFRTGEQSQQMQNGVVSKNPGLLDVLDKIIEGRSEEGRELSRQIQKNAVERSNGSNSVFGRSRGVLATTINYVTSGAILVTVISAMQSVLDSQNAALAVFILLSALLVLAVWALVVNVYTVISRRIFLEGRTYDKIPVQRFLFLYRIKKWHKAAATMLVTFIYQLLWNLTIVGGIIKRYSYYLVPYIVAENPDMTPGETIALSRKMMDGNKWQCFLFELSFIGWSFLGVLTFGLVNIFYTNPYKVATFSEYYTELRKIAKNSRIEGAELLNDHYLYEKADSALLQETYRDVVEVMNQPEVTMKELTGIRGFLAKYLGIIFFNSKKEREYEESQARHLQIRGMEDAVTGDIYPSRLANIPEDVRAKGADSLHYIRHYSLPSLIMLFFSFSFIGWVWEVSLHLISDGEFVNRGVLHGPWLPIYGSGGVLILLVLNRLRSKPVAEFFGAIVLCGILEYFTGYYLEITHNGQRWWDYRGYFLNLDGRICAEGLLVFGIGGMAIVYAAAPFLDNQFRKIKRQILIPICALLLVVYVADQRYSSVHPNTGKGITDYEASLSVGPHLVHNISR